MVMNIVYSTVVACLVEVFLIANVSMISSYLRETRYRDSFFLRLTETETLMAFVYLLSGIAIFSILFEFCLKLCDRLFQKCIRLVRNHFLGADRLWNFRIFLIEECEKFLFEPGNLVNLYIQQIFSGCHIQRDNLVFYRHGLILRLL